MGPLDKMALRHLLFLVGLSLAQHPGSQKENEHLSMKIQECSAGGSCKDVQTKVTLDSNWRWLHIKDDYVNCYDGNLWDDEFCPDNPTCTENCELEGVDSADWTGTYGVTETNNGHGITLKFVTHGEYSSNVGSRSYLLAPDEENYYMLYLPNKEFTFDVDVSNLPCGLNGALYFVEMDEAGRKYPTNTAGASYGTRHSVATAYTPHTCDTVGNVRCEGTPCGDNASGERYDGLCDKDGCDFNSWRLGDQTFFGPGSNFAVNSEKPMTVVTVHHQRRHRQ